MILFVRGVHIFLKRLRRHYASNTLIYLAKYGITVNAVMPGYILTEGLIEMGEAYQQSMAKSCAIGQVGNG